jgi:transposase
LFPDNIGSHLSLDETALSQGELYTILTNKQAKGGKGALVAMIKGVRSEDVIKILKKIPKEQRDKVEEITLDMAATMEKIASKSFPKANLVTDRFHVQKLAFEALQDLRIMHRWEAIEQENNEKALCKEEDKEYIPNILENGDTLKQLLARARYLLFKQENKWTPKQRHRAEILFNHFPDLKIAYNLCRELTSIYQTTKTKGVAYTKLAKWYNKIEKADFKTFGTVSRSIQSHYKNILNFFNNRSTNAAAESFNAKIKGLRSMFRGVKNIPFFLYRVTKIYA